MGRDILIFVKAEDACCPQSGYADCVEVADEQESPYEATHQIEMLGRFYGIGYDNGNWPQILGVLVELLATCEKVWYGSDADDSFHVCTFNTVMKITKYYIKTGG